MTVTGLIKPPPGTTAIPADKLDRRSDDDIAAWLRARHHAAAAASEKNVWAFWNAGFDAMPPWARRNVINWVRRLGPDWTVHVLDTVPRSETHVGHFLDESVLPPAFNAGTMDGPTVGQHQADLVRLPLIHRYGGVWMDVGMLLFRHLDDICWNAIADPRSPFEVGGFVMQLRPGVECMMNSFIAARKGNVFIKRWHDLFLAVWGRETNAYASSFHTHPLLRCIPMLKLTAEQLHAPEATVSMAFLSDYLAQVLCFERLRKVVEPDGDDGDDDDGRKGHGFSGPAYYAEHVFLLPSMTEMYHLQGASAWQGPREFELLSKRCVGVAEQDMEDDAAWTEARETVDYMLANTATMKLSHAPPGEVPFLADIWSRPEHADADIARDTFAAYMRYGSVHFDQVRDLTPMKVEVETRGVLRLGLLDPGEAVVDDDDA